MSWLDAWLRGLTGSGESSWVLRWDPPLPVWVGLVLFAGAVAVIAWLYGHEPVGRRTARWLVVVRGAVLAVLLVLLGHPSVAVREEEVRRGVSAWLVDVSRSMGRRDTYGAPREREAAAVAGGGVGGAAEGAQVRPSRLEVVQAALRRLAGDGQVPTLLGAFLRAHRVALLSVGEQVRRGPVISGPEDLGDLVAWVEAQVASSPVSRLGEAVARVVDTEFGGPLGSVVLFSDGLDSGGGEWVSAGRRAREAGVPVFVVLAGASTAERDVALGLPVADRRVLVGDLVAVRVPVRRSPTDAAEEVVVRLFEEGRAEPLSEAVAAFAAGAGTVEVELRARPAEEGVHRYRVEIAPRAGEADVKNNVRHVEVEAVPEKVRVLYVEGYPRFEYRFLKNALLREESMESSIVLLSADSGFPPEGTRPIARFPTSRDGLLEYDVVLLGDVPLSGGAVVPASWAGGASGGWISRQQQEWLVELVADRGGGFGVIAGERFGLGEYAGTVLEKMLPVEVDGARVGGGSAGGMPPSPGQTLASGFRAVFTPAGREHAVFRFSLDPAENEVVLAGLPMLYWFHPVRGVKPAAVVLAEHPRERMAGGAMPLFVVGRYGAGRTYVQLTDETWRWRREHGETVHDGYWVSLVRYLAEQRLLGPRKQYRLYADRRSYRYGEPVEVTLEVLDAAEARLAGESVPLMVVNADGQTVRRERLRRAEGASADSGKAARAVYRASLVPPEPGGYELVAEPGWSVGAARPRCRIEVAAASLEREEEPADHESLRLLAESTGGEAVYPDEIGAMLSRLPDRTERRIVERTVSLWDHWAWLAAVIVLFGTEWVVRKRRGLV